MSEPLLRIENLSVAYYEAERTERALDSIDLELSAGQILAIIGESGCGKTTLATAILGLIPHPGRIDSGAVLFEGHDVLALPEREITSIRGRAISMIFQDPVAGLNPTMAIGDQVGEIVRAHRDVSKKQARELALDALTRQGIADAARIAGSYPFQLSGGMCQRVMIAIATMLEPRVLIADEPTSAVDVTVQAAILHQIERLRDETGAAILLISHDLGVVAQIADDVAVMYAGRIVETAAATDLYERARHPYTAALLEARPRLDDPGRNLRSIPGAPPDLAELTGGCAFLARCNKAINMCREEEWPALREVAVAQSAACYNPVVYLEDGLDADAGREGRAAG